MIASRICQNIAIPVHEFVQAPNACDALVDLIKEHGMWKDKEDEEEAAAQEEAQEDAEAEVALA